MSDAYTLIEGAPAVADYRRLREVSGLSPKTQEAAERGLRGTLFAVTVAAGGRTIAMGRVIGDGGAFYQVVDMAVEPEHQGRGLGRRIFAALMDWLHENAPNSAYVSLVADGDARHLYAKFGFEPVMPASIGMARWIGGRPARGT
ncbi:N-acetyltransferase [Aureimonas flava]|uniref:N-acetyltransferase n=1 Tax=Aureimonas flava TaxID=2320271 RepID=A0A3A1WMQ1_9HYPH|nr:GNAT family N-acetyltransferase [Aureimonas flava]RIY01007.1 N-acetyltransferase [Aureimonas flava]